MTPFDPIALLVMLQTFYPVVGPAAFERARRERPEYFAGGTIIGTGRDKIQLPDGRIFDCVFNVGGLDQRWQALEILPGDGGGGPDDPFRLEPGPFTPIDESAFVLVPAAPVFEPLVAGALGELVHTGGVLEEAHGTLTVAAAPGDLEGLLGSELGAAAGTLDQQLGAAGAFVPDDVLAQSAGQAHGTDAHAGHYDEPIPGPFPPGSDPIRPPPGGFDREE